jgi:hypothetical protein
MFNATKYIKKLSSVIPEKLTDHFEKNRYFCWIGLEARLPTLV